jgi:hypothetical protein
MHEALLATLPRPSTPGRVAIGEGPRYRVTMIDPARSAVVPTLARELERVFDLFAREAGAAPSAPIPIRIEPGIFGHHQIGRAADIYAVGGLGLGQWWRRWRERLALAAALATPLARRLARETEEKENLGWRLYQAMRLHGRWAQPYGHPVQLFGPWTRESGPWRHISDFLLRAHRDHIHCSK